MNSFLRKHGIPKELLLFLFVISLNALAAGLSDNVSSNYFKEVYNATALQRGFIEFPREMPGILCIFAIAALSFLGDVRTAIIAQFLSAFGILVLGFYTPSFNVMLVFLFIHSLGMHIYLPLNDVIGISLVKDKSTLGKRMGQYSSLYTAFAMVSSGIIFFGFRYGVFSFQTPVKTVFVLAGVIWVIVAIVLFNISKVVNYPIKAGEKFKLIIRKEYRLYYVLSILRGAQKQIMLVYAPWLLIEILGKKADTIALISIVGSFIGIFFMPMLGKWIDRFGVKKMLYLDALSFIFVYLAYGLMSSGFTSGLFTKVGLPVLITMSLIILDKMSMQMGIIKTLYLRSIVVDEKDITKTLSLGISLDHVVSIFAGMLGGVIWVSIGAQYIFYIAAVLSVGNLIVAYLVKEGTEK